MSKTFLTLADAFVYYADCQLATVETMAMKKSKGKGDYERAIRIAQGMVDNVKAFGISPRLNGRGIRVGEVFAEKYKGLVSEWAKKWEVSA